MFLQAYNKALEVIKNKPMTLWGLSLMNGFLCFLAILLCLPLGIVASAFCLLLEAGMAKVYLDGLDGKQVNSDQLFAAFNKGTGRILGGMAWKSVWSLIWAFVPVMGIIKSYAYAFVPYILMEQPDISATEALRLSMKQTNGRKGQMFLADAVFVLGIFVIFFVLACFARIPYIGIIFGIVMFVAYILLIMFSGLFVGLYRAYFYKMPASADTCAPQQPEAPQVEEPQTEAVPQQEE